MHPSSRRWVKRWKRNSIGDTTNYYSKYFFYLTKHSVAISNNTKRSLNTPQVKLRYSKRRSWSLSSNRRVSRLNTCPISHKILKWFHLFLTAWSCHSSSNNRTVVTLTWCRGCSIKDFKTNLRTFQCNNSSSSRQTLLFLRQTFRYPTCLGHHRDSKTHRLKALHPNRSPSRNQSRSRSSSFLLVSWFHSLDLNIAIITASIQMK